MRLTLLRRMVSCALLIGQILLTVSCSRQRHRIQADREVERLVTEKVEGNAWERRCVCETLTGGFGTNGELTPTGFKTCIG